jgi:hypothetical protein
MKQHNHILGGFALAAGLMLGTSAFALPAIDGALGDWTASISTGIDSFGAAGTPSTFCTAGTVCVGGSTAFSAVAEDTNDGNNAYAVGPNAGGQNYDTEYMAAAAQGTNLYLAIVSGQRRDNGSANYSPGDIRITNLLTGNVYAIEMGGGTAGGATGTINGGDAGFFYNISTSSGQTLNGGSDDLSAAGGKVAVTQTAGSIWLAPGGGTCGNNGVGSPGGFSGTWYCDPIDQDGAGTVDVYEPTQFDSTQGGASNLGNAIAFVCKDNVDDAGANPPQHAICEMQLDVTLMAAAPSQTLRIAWGPACGNDFLDIEIVRPPGQVPVPGVVGVFGLGLGLLGLTARRRRKAA